MIIKQGAIPFLPNSVEVNNVYQTLVWKDGVTPTGRSNAVDVVELTLLKAKDGYNVLGELKSFI